MNGSADTFTRLARALGQKAEALGHRRALARQASMRRAGTHWRSAPYLWPLFGSGG